MPTNRSHASILTNTIHAEDAMTTRPRTYRRALYELRVYVYARDYGSLISPLATLLSSRSCSRMTSSPKLLTFARLQLPSTYNLPNKWGGMIGHDVAR